MKKNNEMEGMLKGLLSNPKGMKALADLDKYKKLLDTPEGKALMSQLGGEGGDALKKAAQDASNGNTDSAMKLISSLLSSPEGAKLVNTIAAMSKEKK